jgi:long-subunit fatty acid transport protein
MAVLLSSFVRVVLITVLLVPSRLAQAQTSLQIPLQFDFVNPGAKSLALAGAFAGVADDATSSFANPAGLMLLEGPEVSAELRGARIATPFLSGGRLSGQVTNLGVDTVAGPVFGDSVGSHLGLGYLSVVYPHPSRRWVVAGYRHELARVDQRFTSQGAFQQDPTEFTSRRDFIQDVVRQVSIDGYGAAGAYKLTPSIALGGGIVVYRFDIDSTVERFLSDGFFGPVNRVSLALSATQLATDVAIAPTVGATVDHRAARFGVVYRGGPTFRYDTVGDDVQDIGTRFAVPHVLAFGVSTRTSAGLLIAAEVSRIFYSRIERDFVTSQARGLDASFQVDDGTELHVGAQYALRRQSAPPIRLRVGSWYDPDHSVKFRPAEEPDTASERLRDERLRVALSKGSGQVHVTGGVGWTLAPRLEFNAGADFSARARLVSASVIVRLGKGL